MKFPIRKKEIARASLLGLCTGVVGVLLFILLLNSMNADVKNEKVEKSEEEKIPASTETKDTKSSLKEGTYEQFYANQHGVFSSFESANEFVSNFPSLNTSAIIQVGENYYVWSSVSPTKENLAKIDNPSSFVKPFKLSGASCKKTELQQLPTVLKSNDKAKFYFDDEKTAKNYPTDWKSITVALTNLSEDLSVIRMHLLAHYFSKNDCLKIEF